MVVDDKMKNKADQASGKVKETVGKITGNEQLEAEGRLRHNSCRLDAFGSCWTRSQTAGQRG
ncbi:MAG: CsbD family protein [Coriobacteriia bacterium]|nr:CsbD family protein [Coriobacteriia bacterium]